MIWGVLCSSWDGEKHVKNSMSRRDMLLSSRLAVLIVNRKLCTRIYVSRDGDVMLRNVEGLFYHKESS
jgi:hypothetical protein